VKSSTEPVESGGVIEFGKSTVPHRGTKINMPVTIDILVVDDSPLMQRLITRLLESDPGLRVVDTAADGYEAIAKVESLRPDVVTLDIEMPRMNGLDALRQIMQRTPTPVIMFSGVKDGAAAMRALELGAIEFVVKPSGTISIDVYKVRAELINKIKLATLVNLEQVVSDTGPVALPTTPPPLPAADSRWLLAIGASTGGPKAIGSILQRLPAKLPASVLVVQHMPAGFTASFAKRLDQRSPLHIEEARDGQEMITGVAYIAPGGFHTIVTKERGRLKLHLQNTPPVNSVRPSVDKMMASAARLNGFRCIGVLLTGMGNDGAAGMAQIKAGGGITLAQDKESSTIFGMPRAAIKRGVVDRILSISEIPRVIVEVMQG